MHMLEVEVEFSATIKRYTALLKYGNIQAFKKVSSFYNHRLKHRTNYVQTISHI